MAAEPAHSIIRTLGGPSVVAERVGIHRTRVSNWTRSKDSGGTGGLIPAKHYPSLLSFAREKGVPLSAADFLPTSLPSSPVTQGNIADGSCAVAEIQSERVS